MAEFRGEPPKNARYLIERHIGEGGYARVGRAKDTKTGRNVAVKILKDTANQLAVERFRREVEEVSKLNSPRIVKILDFNLEHDPPFYVMPLYEKSLRDRLNELRAAGQVVTPQYALQYLLSIVDGLSVAHQRNIFHRDLKPENILLDKEGELVISDFGVGKFAHRQSMMLTVGGPMGTFEYCSPEQWETGEGSAPADIYSLGIMLFEFMTGSRPNRTPMGLTSPNTLDARIPDPVNDLYLRMVAPLGRRLQTCADLRAAIEQVLERQFGVRKPSGVNWGAVAAIGLGALFLWGLGRGR